MLYQRTILPLHVLVSIVGWAFFVPFVGAQGELIEESFNGWSKPGFSGGATYSNAASGVWYTENAVVREDEPGRGYAVRFNDAAPAPVLEYRGPAGEGLAGGIESVAFDYAHWNGGGANVRFQLQYSVDGETWEPLDDEVIATDFSFTRYTWSGQLLEDPLFLRVKSTAHSERLLINDFEIQPYLGPRIHLVTNWTETLPDAGQVHLVTWVDPPVESSVEIVIEEGKEWEGSLFSLAATQLVYSVTSPTQTVSVTLSDPGTPIPDPEILFVFTNATGATLLPDHTWTLSILDQQLPRVSVSPSSAAFLESDDPFPLSVTLTEPGHATVAVHRAGTAVEHVDYTLSATQLVFEANGPGEKTLWVSPIDNDIGDGDRTVELMLLPVAGVNPGDNTSTTITIIDDEPFAQFSEPETWLTVESGPTLIPITLDEPADAHIGIEAITEAWNEVHFELHPTSLVYTADGPATQYVTFTPLDIGAPSPPYHVTLQLVGNQGFQIGAQGEHHIGVRSHDSIVLMAANLTSGNLQRYEAPGYRLFRGLMPDIIGVQEFRTHGTRRDFVDEVFGPEFHYVVDSDASLPCGIISRWPIVDWGIWPDSVVGNRDFIWAIVDVPHLARKVQIVSAHFYASGTATHRNQQANTMVHFMNQDFHPGDYTVVAADLNTQNRGEAALSTLAQWVLDDPQPTDQLDNPNTNQSRIRPYDYVLTDAVLGAQHRPLRLGDHIFTNGLVFDSRLWSNPPHPIEIGDSGVNGMQHMGVLKYFEPVTEPNIYARGIRIMDLGDGVEPLQRGRQYGWELEWGVEGTATMQNVAITIESLSSDIMFDGACNIPDTLVDGYGPYTSTGDCIIAVSAEAENGEHPVSIVFTSDTGAWTNIVHVDVLHDFIAEAVDTPGWTWTHEGDWFLQTNITTDGIDAIMNSGIPPNSGHWIETVVEGPGRIHFDWWLNDEGMWSHPQYVRLTENGLTRLMKFSGGWESVSQHVSSGLRTLRWQHYNYSADYSMGEAAVDQVWFEPYTNQVLEVNASVTSYHFTLGSTLNPDEHRLFIRNLEESPMSYSISTDTPWLSFDEASGTVQGPLAFGRNYSFDLAALVEGIHTTRVEVVAPEADHGEQEIQLVTHVHPEFIHPSMPSHIHWSSGGAYGAWIVTNSPAQGEAPMLRSGRATWNHDSWLVAEVAGPGTISFDWHTEHAQARIDLYVNDNQVSSLTESGQWAPVTIELSPGLHTVTWRHVNQDGSHLDMYSSIGAFTYSGEPDQDADGLPDWWETLHFGHPTAADPQLDADGDGFSNWQEFVAGTDPLDSNSFFHVSSTMPNDDGLYVLISETLTNRWYGVIGVTSLQSTQWTNMVPATPGTGGDLILPITNAPPTLFLRGTVSLDGEATP